MIEKIKYIYELQKYGFQRKTQLVSMLIMYVIGLVMEVVSHGTYWLGMFFMMMTPLFVTQTLYSTCMSGLVAASPRGKQIQTSLACLGDLVTTLVSMSILVVLKIVEVKVYPDHARVILSAFVILCLIMIIVHLYTALVYKYYAIDHIVIRDHLADILCYGLSICRGEQFCLVFCSGISRASHPLCLCKCAGWCGTGISDRKTGLSCTAF